MATLSTYGKQGNLYRVLFFGADDRRRTLRLGKIPKKAAVSICGYVERLATARRTGTALDAPTLAWLAEVGEELHAKLARLGLVDGVADGKPQTLKAWCDWYIAGRTDLAPRSRERLTFAAQLLCEHFDPERRLATVTAGDAEGYDRWLRVDRGYADNTARRRIGWARQFFAAAVRHEVIAKNPFFGIAANTRPERSRDHFVARADVSRLLAHCPDLQWKAIIVLARYAGLRCPSELIPLRWDHILWDQDRMTVTNVKTGHATGNQFRVCPLFPEVRAVLAELWEAAEEGSVYVITRYRDSTQNLGTQLARIARRAGVPIWGKAFINLRASRATELAEDYPSHVAAAWLGHSVAIADAHYRQVTEAHFERAARHTEAAQETAGSGRQRSEKTCSSGEENSGEEESPGECSPVQYTRRVSNFTRFSGGNQVSEAEAAQRGGTLAQILALIDHLDADERAELLRILNGGAA